MTSHDSEPTSVRPLTGPEIDAVRADFPYLKRPARNGEPLAYLDWAATSQKPSCVMTREAEFLSLNNGAAGRSTYQIADEATQAWEDAREAVAGFVGARGGQLVFTKNATEAINLVALAIGHASLGRRAARGGPGADADDPASRLVIGDGDEIVVTRAEHHANLVPWQELAARTGVAASTVHRILRAAHLNRLSYTDRATGQVVHRYEHPYPGSLIHVDVKKIGNIPDGGGWRYVGARQGARNRASTPGKARSPASRRPVMGYACVHSVIDDYSRVVYSEIHDDEKADTAVGVLQRAVSWFSARGVKVERVLSDNGSAYRSQAWQAACQQLGIKAKHTRPYRPQTNGKIERFHRTLADGWAYARHYTSETQRRQALPAWLHLYNHHRPHTTTQDHPPITRLTNLFNLHT